MNKGFKQRLKENELLVGTIITLPSPAIAEILCSAGFDWLFVDLEHSAMTVKDAQNILRAVPAAVPCVVRVPANEEVWIKKCLDIGASGIMVPQVKTPEEAKKAVQLCNYPPEGSRSVGIARAHGYGAGFQAYVSSANREIAVILQIEHINAVDVIADILAVPGIDGIFVGPYDLSASLGKLGLTTDPEVLEAIDHVKHSAASAGIPLGIFGAATDAVKPYIQQGYTLIAAGMDTLLLDQASRALAASLKNR